ncbi:glutathione S-transferase 3-like isoform X1 [Mixophyes fleayi]|uniref:glutathione S-transferase 3-like isoform X1 n=1 Tax=Mixophyes fleayi TaxID=3061075 RepID=UPI003F4DB54A
MTEKPRLHYFNGRGRMECVRWLLSAAGVAFEEQFYDTKEEFEKLLKSGDLMFQQVPMVEIDGLKLVQTRAILNYIAGKYNLNGKDLKEKAYIDMYAEGVCDLFTLVLSIFFLPEDAKEKQRCLIKDKAVNRYLPVYNKALENQDFLVGNQLSMADVLLLDVILSVQEFHDDILQDFPNLQAFKERISEIPTINKFLQPGSQRKPMADAVYVETVKRVLYS